VIEGILCGRKGKIDEVCSSIIISFFLIHFELLNREKWERWKKKEKWKCILFN